jgi:hypothetical protein
MSPTANKQLGLASLLSPVSLEALNRKAPMLTRLDNKYVLHQRVLEQAGEAIGRHFDVLEIGARRAFTYETCYFDDAELRCYHDHRQGRRQRFKVRVRRYPDDNLCFVEVKLKDKRGVTVKRRLAIAPSQYGRLDELAMQHVLHSHHELYGRELARSLAPTLEVRYERMTLVAKDGGERLTIDRRLEFSAGSRWHVADPELLIVETKSRNGNGVADRILRAQHQHPTAHCSKYCVGMNLTGVVQNRNKFLPALRKLGPAPLAKLVTFPFPFPLTA